MTYNGPRYYIRLCKVCETSIADDETTVLIEVELGPGKKLIAPAHSECAEKARVEDDGTE